MLCLKWKNRQTNATEGDDVVLMPRTAEMKMVNTGRVGERVVMVKVKHDEAGTGDGGGLLTEEPKPTDVRERGRHTPGFFSSTTQVFRLRPRRQDLRQRTTPVSAAIAQSASSERSRLPRVQEGQHQGSQAKRPATRETIQVATSVTRLMTVDDLTSAFRSIHAHKDREEFFASGIHSAVDKMFRF